MSGAPCASLTRGVFSSTRYRFDDHWISKKTRSKQGKAASGQCFSVRRGRYPNDAVSLEKQRLNSAFSSARKPLPAPSETRLRPRVRDAFNASSDVTEMGGSSPGRGLVSHRKGAALISRQRNLDP